MKTIKVKLFLLFTMFMFFLVFCGIIFNALFLERYYIYKNRDIFIDTSKEITEEYINNKENISNFINEIDYVDGISCTIADINMNVKYYSFSEKLGSDETRLPKEIEQFVIENKMKLLKTYVYSTVEKPNGKAPKLVFSSRMNNGELIILKKPMQGIKKSVFIANQFYIFAGLIIIFIGGIFIFIFSRKITKPIIEMSNVAEDISNLEFDKRVNIYSQDEIGILGKSINKISEKLSTSINELTQDVERRKHLVRDMSHELKTPISIIKGYAEGLKYGVAQDKEKMEKYCNVICEECDRMDGMVRELLSLSMMESGTFQLNITMFNVGDLIQNTMNRFTPVFIEKGITYDLKYEDFVISADYELVERSINNFITNAINHVEGRKHIKVTVEKKGTGIKIIVFNTGNHIPENDLEKIWDVYYKVDQARSRQYGGHGLGLSIVRLIAKLHGGITGVENVNEGVIFFVKIP
ncbi:HAMP domain-containing sensor histidine kinase [Clostridium uliginosum]|uniref:histidine kinase n=1 Tax=Clostridium uliginosum TaxID=119641 RepID=A0A1I1QXZ8_9CLOT|nr:HAMP domain-containing sensor histidine kinase [Clostridium uliginosum]SFD26862.1 Signal transduction histidine kinase [Clostridium uliginosum]